MNHILPLLLVALLQPATGEWDACTSIAAGREAITEGSGIATHNNDCAQCDPRMAFIPARDYAPGSRRPIAPFRQPYPRYVGSDRSATYARLEGQTDTAPIGFIAQVPHTFAYWEAAYPLVNEHGVGFGESTCGAQLVGHSAMDGGEALMSVAELMKVALERCKTGRCAIDTMGAFGVSHGFYGEDPGMPGAGESLAVVDRDETWVFHITGGLNNKSATWVAQRVPDNHISVVANNFIIQKVNCKDTLNFMCSANIFSNAREAKLCEFSTEHEFNWLSCYGTDVRVFHYTPVLPPIPFYTTLRMWRIHNLINSELAVALTDNPFSFPFSLPVLKKVSRRDIMNWTRDYYKDTEFDMSLGIMAGPFNNPNRIEGGLGQFAAPGQFARGISIQRTSYSLVVEAKPAERAGQSIAWFATDQPLTGVFAPFIATADRAASSYYVGRLEKYSRDSAFWAFNFVSNWMNLDFKDMMQLHVGPAMETEQQHIMDAIEALEANWPESKEEVNKVQQGLQERLVRNWWNLADDLIMAFNDGFYTFQNGTQKSLGYPGWWLQMIGYSNDFFKVKWVQPGMLPPPILLSSLPPALQPVKLAAANFLQLAGDHAASASQFVPGLVIGTILGGVMASAILLKRKPVSDMNYRPLLAQ